MGLGRNLLKSSGRKCMFSACELSWKILCVELKIYAEMHGYFSKNLHAELCISRGWLEWIGWLVKNEFGIEVCENGGIKDLGHSVGVPRMNMSKNVYGRTYDIKIVMRKERPLCGFLVDRDPYTDIVFALGVRADKEVIDLIDYASNGASIVNIFFAQIYDADEKCEHFRREDKALDFVDKMLNSRRHKARFLGYMLRCLLEAYTGHRKCDNRDSFRNKRFELASELLERELKVHGSHRDLYGDRDVHPIEHYLDASIVTNGLTRTFSTGAWCHPFKWMERVYKVVGNLGRANPLQTMIDLRKNKAASSVHEKDTRTLPIGGRVCLLSAPNG
ncbi:hypothetical protein SADUNF_Sadunf10G0094400 [Salix dunnii]|uniref:DNA-directed RNA polymerase n=1 Tax=Salix dunnii TaxID=1413687 RepID=A0A835JT55_9ROSI|nr:hypothetical protein SADUNF_Sadunf10G0094400 [Salix dunnii]